MEDIKRGVMVGRRYRNRRIGEFFKELKFTEGRCTGVPKILAAMKNNGSPPPVFETDEERTYFISILKIQPEIHQGVEVTKKVTKQGTKKISEQGIKILEKIIKEDLEMSIEDFLERYLEL
jgi:ATP-dependent DNA helicase RecG